MIIDLDKIPATSLPLEVAISAITLAELATGPNATDDPNERSRRQDRLQRAEATFDPLPFDADAARAHGRVFSAVVTAGRKPRGAGTRGPRRGHRLLTSGRGTLAATHRLGHGVGLSLRARARTASWRQPRSAGRHTAS